MFEVGPAYQKPGETLDWIVTLSEPFIPFTQFVGLSDVAPTIFGTSLMWGFTGKDRDGNLLGGVKHWRELVNDVSLNKFRMLVKKEGGDQGDFFKFQFQPFTIP